MSFKRLRHLAPVLVAVLIVLFVATFALAQSMGRNRLTGVVLDPDGNPIEGVTVILTHVASGDTFETTTDEDGRWIKGNMGRGDWTVDFRKEGYVPDGVTVGVQNTRAVKPISVTLEPGSAAGGGEGEVPEEVREALGQGNALYDAGDYEAAQQVFESAIDALKAKEEAGETLNPATWLLYQNAGNAAFEAGKLEEAAAHYRALAERDPDNVDARIGVAKVLLEQRDIDQAVAELDKIDSVDIDDPLVFYNVGTLLLNEGRSEEAAHYYGLAVERDPEFVDAHFQLALSKLQIGDMEGARSHFERVVELAPESQNAARARDFLQSI